MTEFTALSGNGDTCMTKWDLFLTAYHSFSMNSQVFTIWVCRIQGMNHKPAFFFCVFCLICYFSDALFASLHVSRLFLRQFQTRPPGVGFNSWLICFVLTLVICSGSGLLSQRHWTNGAVLTAHFAYFGEGGGTLASFSSFQRSEWERWASIMWRGSSRQITSMGSPCENLCCTWQSDKDIMWFRNTFPQCWLLCPFLWE